MLENKIFSDYFAAFKKRLAISVILLNVFVTGLSGVSLYNSWHHFEKQAAVSTQNLATALDSYISGELNSIDMALLAVKYETEREFTQRSINSESLNKYIKRTSSYLPQLLGIRVTNARGETVYGLRPGEAIVNVSDRDYFVYARNNPLNDLFISKPVTGRIAKILVINFARRINNPDGSFGGVVFGAVTVDRYYKLFSGINVGSSGSITLRDNELAVIARYPEKAGIGSAIGNKSVTKDLSDAVKAGKISATFKSIAKIDGVERMFSYRKVSSFPLYVVVALANDDYHAEWRKEALTQLSLVAFFALLTLISSRTMLTRWRREKENELELCMAKEELELRVEQRTSELNHANKQLKVELKERKQAEEQTNDAMRYIQTILQTSPLGIETFKATGETISANDAIARIVGASIEQLKQQNIRDIQSWKRFGLLEVAERALATGEVQRHEYRMVTTFGKHVDLDCLFVPFTFSGEQHLMLTVLDITERKKAEEELSYSMSLTNAALESAADGILIVDRKGDIARWNRKFVELWHIPNELCVTHIKDPVLNFVCGQMAQPEEFLAKVMDLYEHPDTSSQDLLQLADGRIFDRHSYPLRMGDEIVGRFWSFRDITDQRKHEKEQLKIEKLESLGVLAGGIAHNFNNILTGIIGNISLAEIFLDPGHKSYKALIEAEKASVRASELAQQLLTFARGGEPIRKITSLQNIVTESMGLVLSGSNVRGIIEIPDSIHAIDADEGQMSQVCHNIVINATHAMPGGGTLTVTARNETIGSNNPMNLHPGPYVCVAFSDEGCGIPDDILKKIFDPYFTTKADGNGLGLASVHSIVSKHNGYIEINSRVGKGTTVTIYLPSIGATYSHYQSESVVQAPGLHFGGPILVMDDEESIRDLSSEMLEYLGYHATTCENGEEAIALYKDSIESGTRFLTVIMDLTIPGKMGGKEAAQQILALDPNACLIVSSGYSNDPIMSEYHSYGFAGAVAKPYNIKEFGQLLSSLFLRRN